MMKTMFKILPGVLLAASASFSNAETFSYNYVELGFGQLDYAGADVDDIRVGGSYDVAPNINVFGEYSGRDGDDSVDQTWISLGAGYHMPLNEQADFLASLALIKAEYDAITEFYVNDVVVNTATVSEDDTGFELAVGTRFAASEQIELNGKIGYLDIFEDSEVTLDLGARFHTASGVSVGLNYEKIDDIDGFVLTGRYQF